MYMLMYMYIYIYMYVIMIAVGPGVMVTYSVSQLFAGIPFGDHPKEFMYNGVSSKLNKLLA